MNAHGEISLQLVLVKSKPPLLNMITKVTLTKNIELV